MISLFFSSVKSFYTLYKILPILTNLYVENGKGQETVITQELVDQMSSSSDSDLIRIMIFFKGGKVFTNSESQQMRNMATSQRQYFHANALKGYGDSQATNVKTILSQGSLTGKCQLIMDLWAANGLACWATNDIIQQISHLSEVREIVWDRDRANKQLNIGSATSRSHGEASGFVSGISSEETTTSVTDGLLKIRAPEVWNLGYRGQGVLIAVLDDGCNYNHPDLANHLWDGSSFTYNGQQLTHHGWNVVENNNDPISGGGHGTRVAGIIVGDGTGGTQTGVAPEAKIMIIRNDPGPPTVNESNMMFGIQWLFALKVQNPTFQYPDIINMSQGMPFNNKPSYEAWRDLCKSVYDAGMLIVAASGNEGAGSPGQCVYLDHGVPACAPCIDEVCPALGSPCGHPVPYTVRAPGNVPSPWIHPSQPAPLSTGAADNHVSSVLTCGATDNSDVIFGFSSQGPAGWENMFDATTTHYNCQNSIRPDLWDYRFNTAPGNNSLIKPDVTAPGSVITTSMLGGYVADEGTSFAAPHATGTIALMIAANPSLRGDLTNIARILQESAVHLGTAGKNNVYGAGRVDAYHAVIAATSITKSSSVGAGWNMVSVPVLEFDFSKTTVYPAANSNAFTLDGTYIVKNTLENGTGYWIKYVSAQAVDYVGSPLNDVEKIVKPGWNMIGSLSAPLNICQIVTSSNISSYSQFKGYNPSTGYFTADLLQPGLGYWVKVTLSSGTTGTLTLDLNSSCVPPPTMVNETPPSPDSPGSLSPADGTTGVSATPTLKWAEVVSTQGYNVELYSEGYFDSRYDVTDTSWTIGVGELSYNTTYTWRVQACNLACSDWTSGTFTTAAPAPAPTLTGSYVTVNSVKHPYLSWTVPAGMGGSYDVYRYLCPPSGGDCLGAASLIATTSVTNYTDLQFVYVKINPVSTAWYYVRANNGTSAPSNHVGIGTNAAQEQRHKNPEEDSPQLEVSLPTETKLMENFPNPFNPTTTIAYQLAEPGFVRLSVFNILGEEIARIVERSHDAGYFNAVWDAEGAPAGIYYARIIFAGTSRQAPYQGTKKLLLMK